VGSRNRECKGRKKTEKKRGELLVVGCEACQLLLESKASTHKNVEKRAGGAQSAESNGEKGAPPRTQRAADRKQLSDHRTTA